MAPVKLGFHPLTFVQHKPESKNDWFLRCRRINDLWVYKKKKLQNKNVQIHLIQKIPSPSEEDGYS